MFRGVGWVALPKVADWRWLLESEDPPWYPTMLGLTPLVKRLGKLLSHYYRLEHNFGGLGLGNFTEGERVPVQTLDSLNISGCHLIKIDVKGMEESVLRGAKGLIAKCQPFLYIENDRPDRSASLIEYLFSLDYKLYWHLPPMAANSNFFGTPTADLGRIISVNMICVSKSKNCNIQGLPEITSPESDWKDFHKS